MLVFSKNKKQKIRLVSLNLDLLCCVKPTIYDAEINGFKMEI